MKKNLFLALALASFFCSAGAQYNVSTEVEKKHVLIEEFTGIHCSYCPDAHRRVADLLKVQDNIHAIAFHTGNLATPGPDEPDFRTVEGGQIYAETAGHGMPSGTVNRTPYGDATDLVVSRSLWADFARELRSQDAPVNMWMKSTYDHTTRKLTVDVEAYYTADVDATTNNLVVVVTENNVMGPQKGGGVGEEYMHQHMARAFLTPVWGDEIACAKGTFISKQYVYDVPEMYDIVEANPAEFEVVAFISDGKYPILNATSVKTECPGLEMPLAAEIAPYRLAIDGTYGFNYYEAYFTNKSTETITKANFTITLNKVDYPVEMTCEVAPRSTQYIRIPFNHEGLILSDKTNTYTVKLTGLNGQEFAGNSFNGRFKAPYATTSLNKISFVTDTKADETSYKVIDADGEVVYEFGPYEYGQVYEVSEWLNLESNKTYCIEVADSWASGVNNGYYELCDANNKRVAYCNELYDHGYRTFFTTGYNVSTEPSKRRLLIEEFTGIHCGNCPDGHHQINELLKSQGDKISVIAIHAGHYAEPFPEEPDFRTEVGDSLDTYYEVGRLGGYPSAFLNRTYNGEELLHSRSIWASFGHALTEVDAPVNLWVHSIYKKEENKLYVNVEGYYTADVDADVNFLNVVITQNRIIGVQSGVSNGNSYEHNHVARHYLTPVWGEEIAGCKAGDFFSREYVYEVPSHINEVATNPGDFEVVAFVCREKTDVLNVADAIPEYPGYTVPLSSSVVKFLPHKMPVKGTYAYNYYDAYLENNSTEEITDATFTITLNDVKYDVAWQGSLAPRKLNEMRIMFDHTDLIKTINDYEVTLKSLNNVPISGHSFSGDFQDPVEATPTIKFMIKTDNYADENTYVIKDMAGNAVHEFGPYPVGVVTEVEEYVELTPENTYCFEIADSWGNGILLPRGTVKMYNSNGKLISQQLEIKDHGCRIFFTVVEPAAVGNIAAENNAVVYYNSALDAVVVKVASQAEVTIYNVAGECIYAGATDATLQVPVAAAGVYVVKVVTPTAQEVVKVVAL